VARSQKVEPEAERMRQDLRALLNTLRSARPQVDNSPSAIKAATLASLVDFVQARIEALASPAPVQVTLMEVPPLDQPELPIPKPSSLSMASPLPAIALVASNTAPATERAPEAEEPLFGSDFAPPAYPASNLIPEIEFVTSDAPVRKAPARRHASAQAKPAKAAKMPAPAQTVDSVPPVRGPVMSILTAKLEIPAPLDSESDPHASKALTLEFVELDAGKPETAKPVAEPVAEPVAAPLAGILALTEEERLALFT
jgi:hypothetical protein